MTTEANAHQPQVPAQYLLSSSAPQPRTLIDILYDTAGRYPDAPAIDDGEVQLTYAELISDIEESVEWLAARGWRMSLLELDQERRHRGRSARQKEAR